MKRLIIAMSVLIMFSGFALGYYIIKLLWVNISEDWTTGRYFAALLQFVMAWLYFSLSGLGGYYAATAFVDLAKRRLIR